MLPRANDVRQMSDVERAYIGGLIDTDGWVSVRHRPRGQYADVRVGLGNTEVEIISALLRLTGAGKVSYRIPANRKPYLRWELGRHKSIAYLVEQCAPYSIKLQSLHYEGGSSLPQPPTTP